MKPTRTWYNRCTRIVALILCVAALLCLTACGSASAMEQKQIFAMDTVMTLTAYGKHAQDGLNAATSVINSMEALLDPELPTSTTYAINHANGQNVVVNAQIAKMLSTAKTVYDNSDGSLDLSLYPLIKLWGFVDGRYYVPLYDEISAQLKRKAFDQMVLTSYPATGSYSVNFPAGTEISFGSIGKGCAAENAISAMRQAGVKSGSPVSNNLLSATIICEDGTMADALSTAMFVLGESRALNYWRQYGGFEMILITKSNQVICTKGLIDVYNANSAAGDYKVRFAE